MNVMFPLSEFGNNVVCSAWPAFRESTTWNWTFQGGTPATSTNQNQSVVYNTIGTYDVMLVVGNGVTTDTMLLEDYITVVAPPVATANGTDETCEGAATYSDTLTARIV